MAVKILKTDLDLDGNKIIGLDKVGNFKAVSTEANQGLTDIEKTNARINIGAGTSSFSGNYSDLTNKPVIPALIGDDAARVNWGGDWRMPTLAEFQALSAAVDIEWTTDYQGSGVAGMLWTDKTDSSKTLFFPAAGTCGDGSVDDVGNFGAYWSSSLDTSFREKAYYLAIDSGGDQDIASDYRFFGYAVRPILDGANANSHAYVEIGGHKWATMNVGANSVTDYGLYFQWGDTQGYTASQVGNGTGQKYFGWEDYKYGNGTSSPSATDMTKYNDTDSKTVLELPTPIDYLHKVAITGNYNDLSNKPTSLPANGGNADTVDGKHAEELKPDYIDTNGFLYVDLGLPSGTLWATSDLGANNYTQLGSTYLWGKTAPYDGTDDSAYDGTEDVLIASSDAASVRLGGDWRIPTKEQCIELNDNTTRLSVQINGIYYIKYTGKNNKSIYIRCNNGMSGHRWSSSRNLDGNNSAVTLFASNIPSTQHHGWDTAAITTPLPIRPVANPNTVKSVNGRRGGSVIITKSDVGLGNVNNTADANKSVANANTVGSCSPGFNNGNVLKLVSWPSYRDFNDLGWYSGTDSGDYLKSICKWAINSFADNGDLTLIGSGAPNISGTLILHLYSDHGKSDTTGLPRYCSGLFEDLSGVIITFGTSDYIWYSNVIATTSNIPSSLPASDVYPWAKASTKPTYKASEVMSIREWFITENTSSSCSIAGSSNTGKEETIIYINASNSDLTVTIPTTYKTPDGAAIELTCKVGGYCEVSYLNIDGVIYARGL